jgi:hypothetical protein
MNRLKIKINNHRIWWSVVSGSLILLLLGGGAWLGCGYFFPPSLALPADREIVAKFRCAAPGPYRIGDLIPLTLEIRAVKGVSYQLPDLTDAAFGRLKLREKTAPQNIRYQGGSGQKLGYTVTAWETGRLQIPAHTFKYRTPAGKTSRYIIPAFTINISSVLPPGRTKAQLAALKLKAAKSPAALPPTYQPLWYLLAAGAVAALLALIIYLWRKLRSKPSEPVPTITNVRESAEIIAFRRLTALQEEKYLKQGDFNAYYTELCECLRRYLEDRFQIKALEMTTEEFLIYLSGDQLIPATCRQGIRDFLQASDLIKFARRLPQPAEAKAAWEQVYQIVDITKLTPTVNA